MRRLSLRKLIGSLMVLYASLPAPASAECVVTCAAVVPFAGNSGVAISFSGGGSACGCSAPATYHWVFGDGAESFDVNAMHTYASGGTYNWSLTVGSESSTCMKSGQIRITSSGNAPRPGTFSGTTSQGLPFSLTVNSVSQITQWSVGYDCGFGSGSTTVNTFCSINLGTFSCGTTSCSPFQVQTAISGAFDSSTSVSGDAELRWRPGIDGTCCTIDPLPFSATFSPAVLEATASADTSGGVAPLLVNFTGNASGGSGGYGYSWNFGDCSANSVSQNPSHSFPAGNWQAVLTVTDSSVATADAIAYVTALPADPHHFEVAAPATAVVGQPFTITVIARDAAENMATSYDGTVHFTSSDPSATLPGDYAFQPADNGSHTFTNAVTLTTTGTRTLTATDTVDPLTGQASIVVGYASSVALTSSPNPTTFGQNVAVTATVTASGAGAATGTISFYDGATLLGNVSLAAGQATLNTSAFTRGPHGLTAIYSGDANYLGSTSPGHTHYVLLAAPAGVTATAVTSTSVNVGWIEVPNAVDYEVQRSTNNSAFAFLAITAGVNYSDGSASANTTYFYRVRARDGGGNFGALSGADAATTVIFTDDPVVATTVVKASHVTQLRTAINAMRAAASLAASVFTDAGLNGVIVEALHFQEMRTALNQARSQLGLSGVSYTDPTLVTGTTKIKAAHVTELRNGVK